MAASRHASHERLLRAAGHLRSFPRRTTLTFADGTVVGEGSLFRDGSTGNVYLGKIDTQDAELTGDFGRFMGWADEIRTLHVRTNGDTPRDATQARKFGAEGSIGLRTSTCSLSLSASRLCAR